MTKKRLPMGESIFRNVIENNLYYVDKTLLVKDVMDGGTVIVYTRPRRFGKTLNQTMLQSFFEISDRDQHALFANTRIWQEKAYRKHHAKYPVIYLTFKDLKHQTPDLMYQDLKGLIAEAFHRHKCIGSSLDEVEADFFRQIISQKASETGFMESLKKLSEYLYIHYGVKPIVLIDEYDTPVLAAYTNGFYDDFIAFFKTLLSRLLKDNVFLTKAVLTGITRIAKESIFSDLNNVELLTVLASHARDKFGFLREEVQSLLTYYELEHVTADVVDWYDGYNFGGLDVFNPLSIISLARQNGQLKAYWVNTGENRLIQNLIRTSSADFKVKIETLLNDGVIEAEIMENLVFQDLEKNEKHIWTMLLFSGYLKWIDQINEGRYRLTVPNREVALFYRQVVVGLLEEQGIGIEHILGFLLRGEILDFKKRFQEMVLNTLSFFDTGNREPERFYHGLVLGMLVNLSHAYHIKSNREAGFGRADLILIPKDKNARGLVFEFKRFSKDADETLINSAARGLAQIIAGNYISEVQSYGVKDVVAVAIAFDGKQVEIASNLETRPPFTEAQQIALKLLQQGASTDLIASTTGVNPAELRALQQSTSDH